MKRYFLSLAFLIVSCAPSSLSEWRVEGVSVVRDLVEELQSIGSLKELETKKYSIKKKYMKLVSIMLEAEKYEEEEDSFQVEHFYSDALREQYVRLYQIEGAMEVLYEIQKDGLHKLDRAHAKKVF